MDTHAYLLERDDETYALGRIDGRNFSEAIKGSLRQRITLSVEEAIGGDEDVIDLVRGREITIRNARLVMDKARPARQFLTAKGGIQNIRLENVELVGEPSTNWDLAFGQWTLYDQDTRRPPVRGIVLDNVWHLTGRPVRVYCVKADSPQRLTGKYEVTRAATLFVSLWFALQRLRGKEKLPPDYELFPWEQAAAPAPRTPPRPPRASSSRRPK